MSIPEVRLRSTEMGIVSKLLKYQNYFQARKIKLCMAANEKCTAKEVLRNEVNPESNSNRVYVNPDFVEGLDTSDGSRQFDEDFEMK